MCFISDVSALNKQFKEPFFLLCYCEINLILSFPLANVLHRLNREKIALLGAEARSFTERFCYLRQLEGELVSVKGENPCLPRVFIMQSLVHMVQFFAEMRFPDHE